MEIIVKRDIGHLYENLTLEILKGVKNSSIKSVVVTFEPYLGTRLNIKIDEQVKGQLIFIWQMEQYISKPDPDHLKCLQIQICSLLNSLIPDHWTVNNVLNQSEIEMACCRIQVDIFAIKEISWDDLNSYNSCSNPQAILYDYFKIPKNIGLNYSESDWQFLWFVYSNLQSIEESYIINESDKCTLKCMVDSDFRFIIQLEFPSELDLNADSLITAVESRFVLNN